MGPFPAAWLRGGWVQGKPSRRPWPLRSNVTPPDVVPITANLALTAGGRACTNHVGACTAHKEEERETRERERRRGEEGTTRKRTVLIQRARARPPQAGKKAQKPQPPSPSTCALSGEWTRKPWFPMRRGEVRLAASHGDVAMERRNKGARQGGEAKSMRPWTGWAERTSDGLGIEPASTSQDPRPKSWS